MGSWVFLEGIFGNPWAIKVELGFIWFSVLQLEMFEIVIKLRKLWNIYTFYLNLLYSLEASINPFLSICISLLLSQFLKMYLRSEIRSSLYFSIFITFLTYLHYFLIRFVTYICFRILILTIPFFLSTSISISLLLSIFLLSLPFMQSILPSVYDYLYISKF